MIWKLRPHRERTNPVIRLRASLCAPTRPSNETPGASSINVFLPGLFTTSERLGRTDSGGAEGE